jgi:hypothetical protein
MSTFWIWVHSYAAPLLLAMALVLCGAIAWLIYQQRQFASLRRHYQALLGDGAGGNLEAMLNHHLAQVQLALKKTGELDMLIRELERAGMGHLQHCGVVRFNPFRDTGGDQSFALALADGEGYGVIISSLHARESARVYAKPLAAWESSYALTDEERQAIELARAKP